MGNKLANLLSRFMLRWAETLRKAMDYVIPPGVLTGEPPLVCHNDTPEELGYPTNGKHKAASGRKP